MQSPQSEQQTQEANRYQNPSKLIARILHDAVFRKALARSSLYWFGHIYFAEFIHYETADFQREIYTALQELTEAIERGDERRVIEILGFRNSAKSVIVTMIFVIWAMLGPFQAKYMVLIGQTDKKSIKYLTNIKSQLTDNKLLVKDFGPFKPEVKGEDEWQKTSIVVPKYGARIEVYTVNQDVRGIRHGATRPEIVIIDDPDSPKSARKKEQRDKLYQWFKGEVMNVGDRRTIYCVLGNLVHSDGFMARLRKEIQSGELPGILLQIPIADKDGNPMWPGKFPTRESLEAERRKINNPKAWKRENLLQIIPDEGQVVKEEWIKYAKDPAKDFKAGARGIGVDLAISKKDTADYTAMVPGVSGTLNGKPKIYIGPNPINERLTMFEMVERAKMLQKDQDGLRFFVEVVGYQEAAIETMKKNWINVTGVRPGGNDKRARLEIVAGYIQDGTIEFLPGCDDLITQILGLGIEEHDDLADAFVYCILGLLKTSSVGSGVIWL